jgi:hypothetical protein
MPLDYAINSLMTAKNITLRTNNQTFTDWLELEIVINFTKYP